MTYVNGRRDPGFLDRYMKAVPTVQQFRVEENEKLDDRVAEACQWLIARTAEDPEVREQIQLVLRKVRASAEADLARKNYDHSQTQRIRGQIDGLEQAENLLTDAKLLERFRSELLGIAGEAMRTGES